MFWLLYVPRVNSTYGNCLGGIFTPPFLKEMLSTPIFTMADGLNKLDGPSSKLID